MNLTFRQLRVFTEVVRHGSMTRAAAALHLTAPAVSMQVREIETQLGLPLFDRRHRQLALSAAGERFLVHARRLLGALADAENAMAQLRQVEMGRLGVGLVSTASAFVPALLARFRDEHPGVEVRLQVASGREQLVAAMRAGELDLAVMGRAPRELAARAETFAPHPLVFVCAPGHALAVHALQAGTALDPALLHGQDFVLREPASGTRSAMDRFCEDHRIEPRVALELPSNEAVRQAVAAGLGLGFLSLHAVGAELRAGLLQVLPVQGAPVMRAWNVVHLQGKVLSPAAEAFRSFVLAHGQALLQGWDQLLPQAGAADGA